MSAARNWPGAPVPSRTSTRTSWPWPRRTRRGPRLRKPSRTLWLRGSSLCGAYRRACGWAFGFSVLGADFLENHCLRTAVTRRQGSIPSSSEARVVARKAGPTRSAQLILKSRTSTATFAIVMHRWYNRDMLWTRARPAWNGRGGIWKTNGRCLHVYTWTCLERAPAPGLPSPFNRLLFRLLTAVRFGFSGKASHADGPGKFRPEYQQAAVSAFLRA